MTASFSNTWETYAKAWQVEDSAEKQTLFNQSLNLACTYRDPLVSLNGHDELKAYMLDLNQQIPGVHFVTTRFRTHHNRSITEWQMRNGDNVTLGDDISYGEYGEDGKLVAMVGFFDTPEQSG